MFRIRKRKRVFFECLVLSEELLILKVQSFSSHGTVYTEGKCASLITAFRNNLVHQQV